MSSGGDDRARARGFRQARGGLFVSARFGRGIGGRAAAGFATVEHAEPMLSLDNALDEGELREFDRRVREGLRGEPYRYAAELKLDGLSMAAHYRARPDQMIGMTPSDFFPHDIAAGRRGWRALFDHGHTHAITNERRLDGSTMWVEGEYMCFYDSARRITGHFGIQRDVSDRVRALEELEQSRAELRALAARLQVTREEERTRIAREIRSVPGHASGGRPRDRRGEPR